MWQVAVSSQLVKQKFWLVPRANFDTLPPDMQPFSIPAGSLLNLPMDMDPASIWVLDQAISRQRLGRGVLELESADFGEGWVTWATP